VSLCATARGLQLMSTGRARMADTLHNKNIRGPDIADILRPNQLTHRSGLDL
jgi:hypothetical protein